MFTTHGELKMRFNPSSINMIKKIMRVICYVGLGHTAFEIFQIIQSGYASHWYYGLMFPGLNYLLPLIVCCVFLMIFDKKDK